MISQVGNSKVIETLGGLITIYGTGLCLHTI